MRTDPVHKTLRAIAAKLDQLGVPYAVAGGMALVAHGYDRTTVDVDILLTAEQHAKVRAGWMVWDMCPYSRAAKIFAMRRPAFESNF